MDVISLGFPEQTVTMVVLALDPPFLCIDAEKVGYFLVTMRDDA